MTVDTEKENQKDTEEEVAIPQVVTHHTNIAEIAIMTAETTDTHLNIHHLHILHTLRAPVEITIKHQHNQEIITMNQHQIIASHLMTVIMTQEEIMILNIREIKIQKRQKE